jgi:hypothetical protein
LAERLTGDIPPALEITRDDPPWSITFANERPLGRPFRRESDHHVPAGQAGSPAAIRN